MATKKTIIPPLTTRPETDYEFGQRENENIDRAAWSGEHAMKTAPRGTVHVLEIATHVPKTPKNY